jgi:hypothetical protein
VRTRARGIGTILAALLAAACTQTIGGSGGYGTTIHGTADGAPIPTTTSVGLFGSESMTVNGIPETVAYAGVLVTNLSNGCAELMHGGNPSSSTALTLVVTTVSAEVATGTYPIDQSGEAKGVYTVDGEECQEVLMETAVSGSISLTTVSSSEIVGTFDIQMNNGDHLTGSFVAPVCVAELASPDAACGT